jgi:hypothetical protein
MARECNRLVKTIGVVKLEKFAGKDARSDKLALGLEESARTVGRL